MITMPNGIDIHPNYVMDDAGKKLSVIIPVSEFDALLDVVLKILSADIPTPIKTNSAARFKGLLSSKEADDYHTYLKKARSEWDRNI